MQTLYKKIAVTLTDDGGVPAFLGCGGYDI